MQTEQSLKIPCRLYDFGWALGLELKRLLTSRRWIPVLIVLSLGAIKATDQLVRYSHVIRKSSNLWDSYFAFYGSWSNQYLSLVVPILFILLVGDILIKDTSSGYSQLVLVRMNNKGTFWFSKCVAIFVVALCFSFVIFLLAILSGVVRGLPFSLSLSPLALSMQAPDLNTMAHWNVIDAVIHPFVHPVSPLLHSGIIISTVSMAYTLLALIGVVLGIYATTFFAPLAMIVFTQIIIQNYGLFMPSAKLISIVIYFINMVTDSAFRNSPFSEKTMALSQQAVLGINSFAIACLVLIGWIFYRRKEY